MYAFIKENLFYWKILHMTYVASGHSFLYLQYSFFITLRTLKMSYFSLALNLSSGRIYATMHFCFTFAGAAAENMLGSLLCLPGSGSVLLDPCTGSTISETTSEAWSVEVLPSDSGQNCVICVYFFSVNQRCIIQSSTFCLRFLKKLLS